MSNKFAFSYCLLQYMHNPWLKERLNIGVLLYSHDASFMKLAARGWDGRIAAAYPDLDKSAFTEDVKQISRAAHRFWKVNLEDQDLLSNHYKPNKHFGMGSDAFILASAFSPGFDSSYAWTDGGSGICKGPEEQLEKLFQRFVAPYDKEKPQPTRSDDNVWSEVSKLILARKLAEKIDPEPLFQTDLGPITFQAGYQNGIYHAIQPLSFDLKDENRIVAKAGKWSGFAQAVQKHSKRREVIAQFVIGEPSNKSLIKPYKTARTFLKNIVGDENVIEEKHSGRLVDQIEEDLRAHRE